MSAVPGGPVSTGKQRCRLHRDTAAVAAGGGSRSETNRPSTASAIRCVPISDRAMASSLSTGGPPTLLSRTDTRRRSPSGSLLTASTPRTSRRSRTRRPPSSDSMSVAAPAVTGNAEGSSPRGIGPNDISHSTASSQVSHDPPGVVSSSTGSNPPSGSARSARRCCNWRNRTTRVIASFPPKFPSEVPSEPPSTRNWAASASSSPSPASAAPGGPKTPNCQRDWFLVDVPRYG